LLLNTNREEALKKVKKILKSYATLSETDRQLSVPANREHLLNRIADLDNGNGVVIATEELGQ
jgi:hypothetical protein